jgi:hypothetical protein
MRTFLSALLVTGLALSVLLGAVAPVRADSIGMPIRAEIIQCGARDELRLSCERDDRCCVFMDRATPLEDLASGSDVDSPVVVARAPQSVMDPYAAIRSASAPSTRP